MPTKYYSLVTEEKKSIIKGFLLYVLKFMCNMRFSTIKATIVIIL